MVYNATIGEWLAVTKGSSKKAITSDDDALTWTDVTSGLAAGAGEFKACGVLNGVTYIVVYDSVAPSTWLMSSTDHTTWAVDQTLPVNNGWYEPRFYTNVPASGPDSAIVGGDTLLGIKNPDNYPSLKATFSATLSLTAEESHVAVVDTFSTEVGGLLTGHTSDSGHTYTKITSHPKNAYISWYSVHADEDR